MDRIEKIKDFLKKTPDDSFLQHALALEYIKMGKDSDARDLFESILTRDTGYIGSYYQLGKLLERIGESQMVISWYEKGMEAASKARDMHALSELRAEYEDITDS